jgi:acyl-CoA thioesterase-2
VTIPPVFTLSEVLDTFHLEQVNAEFYVGTQIDEIDHHIVGGHVAAQALMAASRSVSERLPHSMHLYFLRRGDPRYPVDFEVTALHDGGTFSARRVTARQFGAVLLEDITSFSAPVESHVYGGCVNSPSRCATSTRPPGLHSTWSTRRRRREYECGCAPT